jgi:hypothetical protein
VKIMDTIDGGLISEEPTERSIWICPECFDAFDRCPPSGVCASRGHAPVSVFATTVRSVAGADGVLAAIGESKNSVPGRPRLRPVAGLPRGTAQGPTPEAA